MHLLTGPAGSGKTFRILEQFRDSLRRGGAGVRLLTPTATMAQHVQNQMAREGFVFRPSLIQTLSRFVDAYAADLPQVSAPLFYLIVEQAARRADRPEFARVVRLPGFCAALARTMNELSSAGCDAQRLAAAGERARGAPLGEAFLAVYAEVDRELSRRSLFTRSQRLLHAAEAIARNGLSDIHTIWLDGFYALPDPELAVIAAMSRHAEVTVALPDVPVTGSTRARLLAIGFAEETCRWEPPSVQTDVVAAESIEREAEEIARRILEDAATGRQFREMAVVVRSPEVYEAMLRATFDRFGIPARFYFDADLERHAAVRFLGGIVDAMLGGWDHAETLAAIRLAPGIRCDRFDFAVRGSMPGRGLTALRAIAAERASDEADELSRLLQSLEELDDWRERRLTPDDWAARLRRLRRLFSPPPLEAGDYELALTGRSQATALDLFENAMTEAAYALGAEAVRLTEFWRAAKSVLRLTPLRVEDNRRNVVHVLDAHEARQWRLPVVFVCGLAEKQFPRFHNQDPFFPEAARLSLQQAGIRLRTTADFEIEERFLFDWSITRATESLTLSYARTDSRGQQNLPSLYLDGQKAIRARPVAPPAGEVGAPSTVPSAITSPDALKTIFDRHEAFQPTSLEVYLQCPFQFFARDTLHLRGAPLRPEQRLDFRTQGMIVHATLADLHRQGLPLDELFERTFERLASRYNVPAGYRTEALRERMLADLRALIADPHWLSVYETRAEQEFQFSLADGVELKGRIDRMDVTRDGGAYVIDYKYSGAQNTKNRAADQNLLQAQLYLLAVERFFKLRPEGMSYLGFKGAIQQTAWAPFAPEAAIETALRIAGEIRAGQVAPDPAETGKCRHCDFRDICRFAAAAQEIAEGATNWD